MTTPATRAAQQHLNVSRRSFLRGLGVSLALPAMESLFPTRLLGAEASAGQLGVTATGRPLRTAFVYFPNGAIPASWWPATTGADFALSPTLEPLAASKQHLQVIRGLGHQAAEAAHEGGNDGGGDHARATGTFLTGTRLRKSQTDIRNGISIDQLIAREIGHLTRFPSLEIASDTIRKAGNCDDRYACAYQYHLSWTATNTPLSPEGNPRLLFERLFGTGTAGQRDALLLARQQQQRSILDFIRDDARAMKTKLSARDQEKLDQYLTGVRELEVRIQKAERLGLPKDPGVDTPAGVPIEYGEYVGIMYDLMLLAFQTDSTRVISFMTAADGTNRSFSEIGVPEGHHDISHHQNKAELVAKVAKIEHWYAAQFARFLKKMADTPDMDGHSLLHNSQILYGSGCADGNLHSHSNLPILLAGGAGGTLQPGRHVDHGPQPVTNIFLSMADRVGLKTLERFGDSTGRLANV